MTYQKLILKSLDNLIEKSARDNLLSDDLLDNNLLNNNLLSDNLLGDNNSTYIDSNNDMDIKIKSNLDKHMTSGKLLKKNSGINVEDLFQ